MTFDVTRSMSIAAEARALPEQGVPVRSNRSSLESSPGRLTSLARFLIGVVGLSGEPLVLEVRDNAAASGWTPLLALNASIAVLVSAFAANGSRLDADWAIPLFYFAIAMVYLPIAGRLLYPAVPRRERIVLVLIATAGLFLMRVVRAPVGFIDHDEFLHWRTLNDILEWNRLFTPNSLLPVSPLFPGLEIVTSAIAQIAGLSAFGSAIVLLGVARFVFMAALFLIFEHVARSARVAAIACVVYMGSSTFFVFDSHFAYESLAVVFLLLAILSDIRAHTLKAPLRVSAWLTVPFLVALSVTHHITAFFAAGIFVGLAVLECVKRPISQHRLKSVMVALCAVVIPVIWSRAMGNPTSGYLGPVLANGLGEFFQLFSASRGRELFVSDDGSVLPIWQRILALSSVAILCAGLATGLLRSLALAGGPSTVRQWFSLRNLRTWTNSRLVLLSMLTFAYPLSILFRLTRSGWEIGNRIGPFSFLGVALVVAVGIAGLWQRLSISVIRCILLACAATVVVSGGIVSAEGPRILVPARFHVSADAASIEPMGIATAEWCRAWLGSANLFASDRINRLLLATYGRQQVATTLSDSRDVSVAIQSDRLDSQDVMLLKKLAVDYILADLRLTTALPVVGVYFDGGAADRDHRVPLAAKALLKFNAEKSVSRIFDNGYQIIFDVRNLRAAQ